MIAIEKVIMWQNTSIIPDENLAHRMGLVPIKADAEDFEYHTQGKDYNEHDSLKFKLHAVCTKKEPNAPMVLSDARDDEKYYNNSNVYSGDIKWVPQGEQESRLSDIRPLLDDILVAKLRPGQEIEMELICEKGIGKTHAKWSPVCTAYYRLLPDISVNNVTGEDAHLLVKTCPMKVFDIEDIGNQGKFSFLAQAFSTYVCLFNIFLFFFLFIATAVVKDSRACTTCRECLRNPKFEGRVNLAKRKDVFEFHVETLGVYTP